MRQPSAPAKSMPIGAAVERRGRAEVVVALGVVVEVVDAEEERVDGRPLEPERDGLDDGRTHTATVAEILANATKSHIVGKLKRSVPDPGRFTYNTKRMAVTRAPGRRLLLVERST